MKNKYTRNCPKCNITLTYIDKRNLNRAIMNKSLCVKCKKMPEGWKEKISEALVGIKKPNYKRNPNIKKTFYRKCPNCGCTLWYISKGSKNCAEDKSTVCNRCSNIKYNKARYPMLKEESRNKMAATKAGFNSYEEYINNLPEIKKYRREVWKLTYKQPISNLPNFNKRGLCGVIGAYQIDHIISISEGYKTNIPPNKIAEISNLQMLPWKQNLNKSNR